jgi:hypothetical protein
MPRPTPTDDRSELSSLHFRVDHLERVARIRGRALAVASLALLGLATVAVLGADTQRQLMSCREKLVESRQSKSALARAGEETGRDARMAPVAAPRPVAATPLPTAS